MTNIKQIKTPYSWNGYNSNTFIQIEITHIRELLLHSRYADPVLVHCWVGVVVGVQTLSQHGYNASILMGW